MYCNSYYCVHILYLLKSLLCMVKDLTECPRIFLQHIFGYICKKITVKHLSELHIQVVLIMDYGDITNVEIGHFAPKKKQTNKKCISKKSFSIDVSWDVRLSAHSLTPAVPLHYLDNGKKNIAELETGYEYWVACGTPRKLE